MNYKKYTVTEASSIYNKCVSENLLKIKEDDMRIKFDGLNKKKASLETMFKSSVDQIMKLLTTDKKKKISTTRLRKNEHDLVMILQDCNLAISILIIRNCSKLPQEF